MIVRRFYSENYNTNCYIIQSGSGNESLLVDPLDDSIELIEAVKGLDILYIFNTHGHFDHIYGNSRFKEITGAKIAVQTEDSPMLTNPMLNLSILFGRPVVSPQADLLIKNENETLAVGDIEFSIKFFPGHTKGCMALYLKKENMLFSGDFIFQDSIGRMDNPSGSIESMKNSLQKLLEYPPVTRIYPGHGLPFSLDEFMKYVYPEIIKEL